MSDLTPAQLAILKERYPGIGEPTLRRNAAALLAETTPVHRTFGIGGALESVAPKPSKNRIRQRAGDGMNNLEREFLQTYLQRYKDAGACVHREVSLPLANGVRYKLDFLLAAFVPENLRWSHAGYEVKGKHAWDDAIVKLKVAANVYPWIKFSLVSKDPAGGWDMQPIYPELPTAVK